jgi:hypothetical protein
MPAPASAQDSEKKPSETDPLATTPSQPQVATLDANKIVELVRTSLLTLNDAIQTGNFTVLRDVGAPGFREANSAAHLSQIFSDLANRRIDLTHVATMVPQLAEAPIIVPATNMLNVKGSFPGKPVQIDFELLFQPVADRWRLFGIWVQAKDTSAQATSANAPEGVAAKPSPNPPTETSKPKIR